MDDLESKVVKVEKKELTAYLPEETAIEQYGRVIVKDNRILVIY